MHCCVTNYKPGCKITLNFDKVKSLGSSASLQKISFVFKFQGTIFFFISPLCILFVFTRGARDFTNQPITLKNSNPDIGKLTWTFCADFWLFLSSLSCKFVTPLLGNLRSFGVLFQQNVVVHLATLYIFSTEFQLQSLFFVNEFFYNYIQSYHRLANYNVGLKL